MNFFPQKKIAHNNEVSVQEVNYSNGGLLVPEKYFLDHNVQFPIFHNGFFEKPSTLAIHRRHGQK